MSERSVSCSVKHKHHSQTSHLDIPKKNVCHTWLLQITFSFILPSNQRWTSLIVVLLHNPSAKEAQNWSPDVVLSITAIHSGAEAAKQLHTIRLSPPCFMKSSLIFTLDVKVQLIEFLSSINEIINYILYLPGLSLTNIKGPNNCSRHHTNFEHVTLAYHWR